MSSSAPTHFSAEPDRLVWRGDGETVVVQAWGADGLRVRGAAGRAVVDTDWALLPQEPTTAEIRIDGDGASITVGRLTARLTSQDRHDDAAGYPVATCRIEFRNQRDEVLLAELARGGSLKLRARRFQPLAGGLQRLTASFESVPDEHLVGMGQYQQAVLDLKGSTLELAHRNSQASVPFVLSDRGYGFLWHNPGIGRATFGRNRTEWVAETTAQLDYWITAGDAPAEITRAYADATGHAPRMPEHGLGYWQCKLRYWNQEQLLEVAREHRRRGLPLDVIVADFFHWPKMGDYRFEEEFWPDPAAMIRELHELGVELMVSVWPQVALESEQFAAFQRRNALATTERGLRPQMGFEGPSMFVDVTNPDGRELLWELCRRNYFDLGVRVFWLDEAEPEWGEYDHDAYRYLAGGVSEVGNLYPQQFSRTFYEGQRAAGQEEVVNLVRCAWAGSQRYGALVWSGDITSSFDDLRRQVTAAIHMGVAGIPWFTTDIGGFHDGDPAAPAFRELLIRWFQFAAFCPVMRMHGDRLPRTELSAADGSRRSPTGGANELWSFGDEVFEVLKAYVLLREELRPYTRAVMDAAHADGQPVVRGLFHEFPRDPRAWSVDDEFLFGPDLLVAPVMTAGARARTVVFPAGTGWTDLRNGERHEGGSTAVVAAPLEEIPVFRRDGAAIDLRVAMPLAVD